MLRDQRVDCAGEAGSMLLGLVVAIFLILLVLGVAAPKVAQDLRREREVEAMHRGNQYVRAIQLYYRKIGHYPGSLEQLEKTNNIRFLRQQYVDPMTGKADWRLIKVGEAKTTVKGFFGQPLAGLTPGLGANAGSASTGMGGAGAGGAGQTGSAYGSSSPGSTNVTRSRPAARRPTTGAPPSTMPCRMIAARPFTATSRWRTTRANAAASRCCRKATAACWRCGAPRARTEWG